MKDFLTAGAMSFPQALATLAALYSTVLLFLVAHKS